MPSNSSPVLLRPRRFGDDRGWFMETYSVGALAKAGVDDVFVQDNQSFSAFTGTIRGIHFQRGPHAQAKLVRCIRGSILDYAVDLRRGSPTYGHHVSARLTGEGGEQLYVPVGFGHAFVTLEPDTEVAYKVTDVYAPDCDGRDRPGTIRRSASTGRCRPPVLCCPTRTRFCRPWRSSTARLTMTTPRSPPLNTL